MSTHSVNIIEIGEVRQHTNAERLEIVPVGGWQAVVKKGQFKSGDKAIYVEPDYVVPTSRPEFSFLAKDGKTEHRLKAVRLRGALSFGLLIPVPDELAHSGIGDNVMESLGIRRYEPPMKAFRGGGDDHELPADEAPVVFAPKFDLENLLNHPTVLQAGEMVVISEKVDGGNAGYLFMNDQFYMRSRTRWLKADKDHLWSRVAASTPAIEVWCRENQGVVLYGEVYGPVQSLKYGLSEPRFVAFAALLANGNWVDNAPLRDSLDRCGVPSAPLLYEGPYDFDHLKTLAESDSRLGPAGHLMEGVVVVPRQERRDDIVGRVALKYISNRFWESEA